MFNMADKTLLLLLPLSRFSCVRLLATPWSVCNLPGSSIHGIFQTRVLEWGAIAFSVIKPYIVYNLVVFANLLTSLSFLLPRL